MKKKYSLTFRQQVEFDIRYAHEWYNKINPELAGRLQNELKSSLKQIENNPSACQIRYRDIRICFLKTLRDTLYTDPTRCDRSPDYAQQASF